MRSFVFYHTLFLIVATNYAFAIDRGYLIEEFLSVREIFTIEQDSTILVFGTTSWEKPQTVHVRREPFHFFVREITYDGKVINKWNIDEDGPVFLIDVIKTSDNGFVLMASKDIGVYYQHKVVLVVKINESMNIEWKFSFDGEPNRIIENSFGDLLIFYRNSLSWEEAHAVVLKRINSLGNELSTHVIYEAQNADSFIVNIINNLNSSFSIIIPKATREFYKPVNTDIKPLHCSVPVIKFFGLRLDEPLSEHNYLLLLINEYGEILLETCFNLFGFPGKTHYNKIHDKYLSQGTFYYLNREKIDHSKPLLNLSEAEEYTAMISTLKGDGSFIKSMNIDTHGESEPLSLNTIKLNDNEYLMFYAHRLGNSKVDILLYKYDITREEITGSHILSGLPAENSRLNRLDAFIRNDENIIIISTQEPIGRVSLFKDLFLHTIKLEDIRWKP